MTALSAEQQMLYQKIKVLSNIHRFEIVALTQNDALSIVDLSKHLKLSYNKTSDYVAMLEEEGLIVKIKDGREVAVQSKIALTNFSVK